MKTYLILVAGILVSGLSSARPDTSLGELQGLLQQSANEINTVISSLNEEKRELIPPEEEQDVQEVKKEFEELTAMGLPPPPNVDLKAEELENVHRNKCPPGYVYIKESLRCYKLVYETDTWHNALVRCQEENPSSKLVSLEYATEEFYVHDLINTYSASNCAAFWTSGLRIKAGRSYRWIWYSTGYDVRYGHWYPRRPSYKGSKTMCLEMYGPKHLWVDSNCNTKRCYICEAPEGY